MGEFLSSANKEKHSEDGENNKIRFGSCGMQGWRKRMEDAHINDISQCNGRFEIFAVFDGHGGKEVAQFAKEKFTNEFINSPKLKINDVRSAIIETFLKMDDLMRESAGKALLLQFAKKSKEEDDLQDKKSGNSNTQGQIINTLLGNRLDSDIALMTGCTACVCIIDQLDKKIYFANAGDSRAVLCKGKKAYRMTLDHKPDLEVEKNRITNANGWIAEGRVKGNLNLSRGFGDLEYKNDPKLKPEEQMITAYPDVVVEDLTSDDEFIILGCDGIWDCLQDQDACEIVKEKIYDKNIKLSSILEKMMDDICAKDIYSETGVGCDNMTCIVVEFKK